MEKRKNIKIPNGRPSEKWTVKQLKGYIRRETSTANQNIAIFRASEEKIKGLESRITRLQKAAGVAPKKGRIVGLGLTYKHKKELVSQARGLYRFNRFEPTTLKEIKQEQRLKKAWETYSGDEDRSMEALKEEGREMSFDDYKQMWDDIGTVGKQITGEFNYQDKMALADRFELGVKGTGKRVNIVKAYENAKKIQDDMKDEYDKAVESFLEGHGDLPDAEEYDPKYNGTNRELIDLMVEDIRKQLMK